MLLMLLSCDEVVNVGVDAAAACVPCSQLNTF
jgi:hypothetical protein